MKSKKISPLIFLAITIVIMLLHSGCATATGVGATPAKFELTINEGNSEEKILYIINTGDTVSEYKIYSDVNYSTWVVISYTQFTLAPNAHKEVHIVFTVPSETNDVHRFYLYIEGYSHDMGNNLSAGLRIPVTIDVEDNNKIDYTGPFHFKDVFVWLFILGVILLILTILLMTRKRRLKRDGGIKDDDRTKDVLRKENAKVSPPNNSKKMR